MDPVLNSPHEIRNCGYYIAGSRVSLASVIHAFREGASPETILQDSPHIGSLARVYGAITFILENPASVEAYLADQERLWTDLDNEHPLSPDMIVRFEKGREALRRQPA